VKVLVALDGSEHATRVIPHAVRLARATGGSLTLLRVWEPSLDGDSASNGTPDSSALMVQAGWKRELEALAGCLGVPARTEVTLRAERENIEDAILRVAEAGQADFIAMDTRGTNALRHLVVGSVATALVEKAVLPVLLTGPNAMPPAESGYCLVVTTDGSGSSLQALRALYPTLDRHPLPVTLLTVHTPVGDMVGDSSDQQELEDWQDANRRMLPKSVLVEKLIEPANEGEGVAKVILRVAEKSGAAAIAMATRGHSARRHAFAGSIAMAVLKDSPLPVILVAG